MENHSVTRPLMCVPKSNETTHHHATRCVYVLVCVRVCARVCVWICMHGSAVDNTPIDVCATHIPDHIIILQSISRCWRVLVHLRVHVCVCECVSVCVRVWEKVCLYGGAVSDKPVVVCAEIDFWPHIIMLQCKVGMFKRACVCARVWECGYVCMEVQSMIRPLMCVPKSNLTTSSYCRARLCVGVSACVWKCISVSMYVWRRRRWYPHWCVCQKQTWSYDHTAAGA